MYRSLDTPPGYFSRLDTNHFHIDTPDDGRKIAALILDLECLGFKSKVNKVLAFSEGPQRKKLRDTYDLHTSGFPASGREAFGSFSTTALPSADAMAHIMELLQSHVAHIQGTVVELEHVEGVIDENGLSESTTQPLGPTQGAFSNHFKDPDIMEIHHCIDVQKNRGGTGDASPIDFASLGKDVTSLGDFGGLFLFDKRDHLAYRVNHFAVPDEAREHALLQNRLLRAYIERKHVDGTCRTLVERVVGIWRIEI